LRLRFASKAPLALAGFLAVPLFLCSLMCVSLAIDRPHRYEWRRAGKLIHIDHPTTSALEAKIWLLALVPSLLLVLAGLAASTWRRGLYAVALTAILIPLATTHRLDRWTAHHTARYPVGVDLIGPSSSSDSVLQGEWEQNARHTALQLAQWTMILAAAAAVGAVLSEIRRRRGKRSTQGPAPPGSALISSPQAPSQGA
jgi:hypothetical protein